MPGLLCRTLTAGALALALGAASLGSADAMPTAPAATLAASGPTTIQYGYGYGYHRYRRYRYNRRHAGLYRCGPGAVHTHLQRQACGSVAPSRRFLYR